MDRPRLNPTAVRGQGLLLPAAPGADREAAIRRSWVWLTTVPFATRTRVLFDRVQVESVAVSPPGRVNLLALRDQGWRDAKPPQTDTGRTSANDEDLAAFWRCCRRSVHLGRVQPT